MNQKRSAAQTCELSLRISDLLGLEVSDALLTCRRRAANQLAAGADRRKNRVDVISNQDKYCAFGRLFKRFKQGRALVSGHGICRIDHDGSVAGAMRRNRKIFSDAANLFNQNLFRQTFALRNLSEFTVPGFRMKRGFGFA